MKYKNIIKENYSNYPWLVFRLNKNIYAINIKFVSSIMIFEQNITEIPNTPKYIKGLVNLRGNIISIVDLRQIFGIIPLEEEYKNFKDMLELRKQEHLNWVKELEKSVETGEKFNLTTDPHKCNFGIWYDNFKSEFSSINHLMKKIDEPHKKLHYAAIEVSNCSKNCSSCERSECLKSIFERIDKKYVPIIIDILDDAKKVFKDNFKEILVVLEINEQQVGIIVDEVKSIQSLSILKKNENSYEIKNNKFIKNVANVKENDAPIMIIDDNKFFDYLNIVS